MAPRTRKKVTPVHHTQLLIRATCGIAAVTKKQAFAYAYHISKGAARPVKLEKAWKYLRREGVIVMNGSKKYFSEYGV